MNNNTYLKPSVEILQVETGTFMDEWRPSVPKEEYNEEVGAKRNNQGSDDDNTNAPQPVAPSFSSSLWDD